MKEYVYLSYATKEDIMEGLNLSEEEVDIALKQLEDLHLITIDEEGRIFDLEDSFYKVAAQWQNL